MADTHGFLDDALFEYFSQCDEIWHAGDVGPVEILHRLRRFKPTRGVYGNIDGNEVCSELPEDLHWTCQGVRVYMTHIGGSPGRYNRRAKDVIFRERPDLFICGHSHILKVMRDSSLSLLHMNPGASGHVGWHQMRTALRFSINNDKVGDVEAIELGPRGR